MFNHLKRTREVEFDRIQESEGEETTKNAVIPGFEKVKEINDDTQKLITELSTPLSLPGASPSSATKKASILLPMQEIREKKEQEVPPEEERPKVEENTT